MKRKYSKPEIIFEDFSLTENIAADCEVEATAAYMVCGVQYTPAMNIFVSGATGEGQCTTEVVETDSQASNFGFCYHVPSANNNVFNS